MVVFTASGSPDRTDWEHVERNKRRIEYAAAMEADCFMFMSGPKPTARPVDEDDIKAAAEGAEAWADYAAQYDLEVSYHIHTNTLIDSSAHWRQYMSLLERTKLCIDVAHAELWGYDPVQAIRDFGDQLNYIHLQDYSSTSRDENGRYLPVWCDVGDAASLDFGAILEALDEMGFTRWVTSCPGRPIPGQDDPLSEARRSRHTREYLRHLGY
jgi:inosose dehydratase